MVGKFGISCFSVLKPNPGTIKGVSVLWGTKTIHVGRTNIYHFAAFVAVLVY